AIELTHANIGSDISMATTQRIGCDNRTTTMPNFHGKIEECRVWNVARTETEIRENMHLPLTGTETGLISYWQFNDGSGTILVDDIGGHHGTLQNMEEADWITSTIPFGTGFADSQIESMGTIDFAGTGLSMDFTSQSGDSITVTRIDLAPNLFPTTLDSIFDVQYWVVNRYGEGSFDAGLTFTLSEGLTLYDENHPSNIRLYSRQSTSDTEWVLVSSAVSVNAAESKVTFEGITGFSQFILGKLRFGLDLKVYLEGPFNGTDMNADLNSSSELPLNQPYTIPPWSYQGTESVITIPNTDIVDWILVELRDAPDAMDATPVTVIDQKAAFLLKGGSVVDIDGSANLVFDVSISEQLFVVVWHRNHPGIMSAIPLAESEGIYYFDFSIASGQAYGTGSQKDIGGGVFGMFAGDANGDGIINDTDKNPVWYSQAGIAGYLPADLNMDGQCDNRDKDDLWVPNQGIETQVPFMTYSCPGIPTVTYQGETYNTVQIGAQCWFRENLKSSQYQNGTPIEYPGNDNSAWENNTTGAYAWYNNDINFKDIFGALYNGYAVSNANGLCPAGWHVPTDDECKILEGTTDSQYEVGDPIWDNTDLRGFDVGKNLKSTTIWPSGAGTNLYRFGALPTGRRYTTGTYDGFGGSGGWWTSSSIYNGLWSRYVTSQDGSYRLWDNNTIGRPVRCLKDN
ncbi:MAG: fibrobacter succinogenes major paralogous domain-containing protein, partial [Bacteroidales bacterium]|nr:fibrobacter succinogenes major paralogous domain-containing protein [Bacteroidales bacterium]